MTTKHDFDTMVKICVRLEVYAKNHGLELDDRISRIMDLDHVHNRWPLRLDALLAAPDFDFLHDIGGIHRHMNRATGELGGCFVPRFTH